jgi:hypothetical protein
MAWSKQRSGTFVQGNFQQFLLARTILQEDVSLNELWLQYLDLSGEASERDVEIYVMGGRSLPELQQDVLALALRQLLLQRERRVLTLRSRAYVAEEDGWC